MAKFYDPNNVVVGEAALFLAPYTTTPAVPPTTLPSLYDAWATPWVSTGGTDAGYSLSITSDTTEVTIEEQAEPVATTYASRTLQITAALAEDTLENIALLLGGTVGVDGTGNAQITLTGDLVYYTAALVTKGLESVIQRIYYIPRNTVQTTGDVPFRRIDKRQWGLQVSSASTVSEITVTDYDTTP